MCTVIVAYKLFPHFPIVVAANRDELLDRPSGPAKVWDVEPRVLAPVDRLRGGTCIGVNEYGVFAALTNRVDIASLPGRATRGNLVLTALAARSAHDAMLRLTELDARDYNGFNLVVADQDGGLYVIRGDGANGPAKPYVHEIIHRVNSGLVLVTNLGIGPDHSPRAEAIMRRWTADRLERGAHPHRGSWQRLLEIHETAPRSEKEWMKRMGSTCIHRPAEDNYGTRSSAFIRLSAARGGLPDEWHYWHRERPASGYACQGPWEIAHHLRIKKTAT